MELQAATVNALSPLQQIEIRIEAHKTNVSQGLIGIGQCLIEAKDAGLVPHGQWQVWVEAHTQLSLRKAQRLMAVAREIPKTSALALLPFTKIEELMAIDGEEREAFAQEVKADELTLRQVQEAIRAKNAAEDALDHLRQTHNESVARSTEVINKLQFEKPEADRREIDRLCEQVASLLIQNCELNDELEKQAEARQAAQRELMSLGQTAAGPEDRDGLTIDEFTVAVTRFLSGVGELPHMGAQLAGLDQATRDHYNLYLDRVAHWYRQARMAVNTVEVTMDE